jgi:predicted nucleic acid-binding Zn ribbon protein
MPVYTYQIIHDDGTEGPTFDWIHKMTDPPLETHPHTGQKAVRIFVAPNIAGANSSHERVQKQRLDDKNLDRLGFTKYVRNGKGHYERTAGKEGPSELHA